MMPEFKPADNAARERIKNDLDSSLFVEAGAGTGKTTALVGRIVNLICKGRTTIEHLAAITFTEKAATELRDRVRNELDKCAADVKLTEAERQRCLEAALGMDNASILTLHSFAGALLREKPLEAGLPPNFSISDDIEADIRFEEKWQAWVEEMQGSESRRDVALAAPGTADRSEDLSLRVSEELLRLLNLGLNIDKLREIAVDLHYSYDLAGKPVSLPPPPRRTAVKELLDALPQLQKWSGCCRNPADRMLQHLDTVWELGQQLAGLEPESDYALNVLRRAGKISPGNAGDKRYWGNDPVCGPALTAVRDKLKELQDTLNAELAAIRQAALAVLLEWLRHKVLDYAVERRAAGRAEFHDLLIWARDLLRDDPNVRRHFQEKYSHILIDEFQDTDPIQAEIAFYLAAGSGEDIKRRDVASAASAVNAAASSAAETADGSSDPSLHWKELPLIPGKLFVVGDPKQSIYRFRRADIATVDEVRRLMKAGNAPLTHNFRSQQPVIDWVNRVFSSWMQPQVGVQAQYLPLEHAGLEPGVILPQCVWRFGGKVAANVEALRRDEYREAALLLHHIRTAPWQVRGKDGKLRPAEFRDACILMPTRTGLDQLERALEENNIPYRIESQSYILGTQDVAELLNCLRAIDSPADQVALVGALRSSAFACSDVELLEYVDGGGKLDYTVPGHGGGRVREALDELNGYHDKRQWMTVDRLIEDFIDRQGLRQSSYGRVRPRERLRRLQIVVDLARAYAQVEGNSLRGYLDWLQRLADERARMQESPVPDTDEDAVRIMTIHSAKGLEFPIVFLLGLNTGGSTSSPAVLFDRQTGRIEASAGTKTSPFRTAGYDELLEAEAAADEAEEVRLMYVAATRARDHLVLSLARKTDKCMAAQILGYCSGDDPGWQEVDLSSVSLYAPAAARVPEESTDSAEDFAVWRKQREAVIEQASVAAAVGVTDIVQMVKESAGGEEAWYRTGRGGTNLGRAVHSVLQGIDLATGAGLEQLSHAQAAAEGIPGRWQEVAKLAQNGLDSAVVKRAVASGSYHREVFVSAPWEGKLLEGFIDIIFEEPDGLVVADYKTDAIEDEEALLQKKDRYELQAGLYALMVEKVTGKKVKEVVLVFLRSKKEICIKDIKVSAKFDGHY